MKKPQYNLWPIGLLQEELSNAKSDAKTWQSYAASWRLLGKPKNARSCMMMARWRFNYAVELQSALNKAEAVRAAEEEQACAEEAAYYAELERGYAQDRR